MYTAYTADAQANHALARIVSHADCACRPMVANTLRRYRAEGRRAAAVWFRNHYIFVVGKLHKTDLV